VQAGLEEFLDSPAQPAAQTSHTIAVLPFDNLSGDPEQEYFSDGISESIILHLNMFPGLIVKSRNSSFAFKQQIKGLGEISAELGVDYLVEGSVRRSPEQIRITVQLVEAASGNQVWGKRYDAPLADLFSLEEDLSRSIAATVTGQIESDLQRIALNKRATDQQAYDLLLAGRYYLDRGSAQDIQVAIEKLNQCLALDPVNALAHTALFWCHDMNVIDRWVEDIEQTRKLADEHIHRAVSLSPESSLVQVAYAYYLSFRSRYDEAEQQLRQALEKNPNDSEAIAVQAVNLSLQGKAEAALEKAELALLLDPYHAWARWIKAEAQFFSGSFEDCLATIASTGNAPGFIQIYNIAANIKLNRLQGAQKALADFLQFCRQNMLSMPRTIPQWLEYYRDNAPFTDPAYNQEIIDCMLQAGLRETSSAKDRSTDEEALPAILVLPFSNLSGDPEQEYFSDGISDSIIVSLSSFAALNVKSRHTSVVYRDSSHSIEEIGAELGVRYVVEGSIRKLGDNVRITVQLGDTLSGNQVWGKRYDSALENLFELEEELVQTIAGTVSGRIEHASQASSLRKPASDMRSYDYLMRGSYHLEKFTARDTAIGIEQFQKCLDIDADNAQAHNALAVSYAVELFENWCADRKAAEAKAYSHIQKALLLAPQDAHVHATMAEHQLFTRDFDLGLFHARRAIELNPTMPDGYGVMAYLLAVSGDIDAALDAADTSMQIDPHHYYMGWNAGEVYRMAGQYQRALDAFRSIPHLSPSVRAQSAACFAALGQLDQAKAQMQRYHRLAHEQMPAYPQSVADWHHYWYSITPYPQDEDFKFFFEQLKQAGLCDEIDQAQTEVPSIAVLPFENMSVDPEQAFFSDGITTDIIATLSKFQHMRVIARHSILQYKNHKASITDIAGEQSVRYILEGSVRKSAEKIRVNAELIDVLSEQNIWSERYDRDLDDIFAVQDDITRNITVALKVALTDGERSASRTIGTGNVKAWELVLLATDLQDSYILQNVIDARKMILQAIELDPNYAYARVALGWTHWQEAYSDWTDSLEHSLADAADAVEQSLQLEPDNAEAWILASTIHITRHESEKAVTASNRALELEPGNAEIQALAGFAMNFIGDYEKATEHFHKALSLCPFCPNWYYLVGAQPHRDTGNLEKAAELLRRGITAEPDSPLCRFYLVDVLLEQGNETEAQQIAAEIRKLDSSMNGRGLTRSYSNDASKRDRFLQNLEKLGLA
jgi:TolB-like protein/Tfp pilus assembly protein PilF